MVRLSIIPILTLIVCSFANICFASSQTIKASGEYVMSEYDKPYIAEQRALDYAKKNAAEKAGIFVETYTQVNKSTLVKDEIKVIASDSIKLVDKQIKQTILPDNNVQIKADITVVIDSMDIDEFLKLKQTERLELVEEYNLLNQAKENEKKEIENLKKQIRLFEKSNDNIQGEEMLLKEKQEELDLKFLSNIEVEKGRELFHKKYKVDRNMRRKIELEEFNAYTKALELNPKNDIAYLSRSKIITDEEYDEEFMILYRTKTNKKKAIERVRYINDAYKATTLNNSIDNYGGLIVSLASYIVRCERLSDDKNLISVLRNQEDTIFNKAISLYPNEINLYASRCHGYIGSDSSRDYAFQVIKIKPDFDEKASPYLIFVDAIIPTISNRYPKEMLEIYNKAIANNPNNLKLYMRRGEILSENKEYKLSNKDYETIIAWENQKKGIIDCCYWRMGKNYHQLGEYTRAIDMFTNSINLNLSDSSVGSSKHHRAEAYFMLGKYNDAINDCFGALQKFSLHNYSDIMSVIRIHNLLANIYDRMGEKKKAIVESRKKLLLGYAIEDSIVKWLYNQKVFSPYYPKPIPINNIHMIVTGGRIIDEYTLTDYEDYIEIIPFFTKEYDYIIVQNKIVSGNLKEGVSLISNWLDINGIKVNGEFFLLEDVNKDSFINQNPSLLNDLKSHFKNLHWNEDWVVMRVKFNRQNLSFITN